MRKRISVSVLIHFLNFDELLRQQEISKEMIFLYTKEDTNLFIFICITISIPNLTDVLIGKCTRNYINV